VCVGDVEVPAGECVLVMWKCQLQGVCVGDVEVPARVCVLACGAGTGAWCIVSGIRGFTRGPNVSPALE
jgi:hypothetical protein